jgi:hypothetical protein
LKLDITLPEVVGTIATALEAVGVENSRESELCSVGTSHPSSNVWETTSMGVAAGGVDRTPELFTFLGSAATGIGTVGGDHVPSLWRSTMVDFGWMWCEAERVNEGDLELDTSR